MAITYRAGDERRQRVRVMDAFRCRSPLGRVHMVESIQFSTCMLAVSHGASTISFVIGGLLTIAVLLRGIKDLRLHMPRLFLRWDMGWRVVRIGIPNFLEGCSMWAANLVVLWFIGKVAEHEVQAVVAASGSGSVELAESGEGLQGAHIIAVQWEAFSFMPGFAIGIAAGAYRRSVSGCGQRSNGSEGGLVLLGDRDHHHGTLWCRSDALGQDIDGYRQW